MLGGLEESATQWDDAQSDAASDDEARVHWKASGGHQEDEEAIQELE